jgi:LysR family transcriptional regulator, glycine cleavage system transcriptional activator
LKRLPPLGALEAFVVVARHESLTLASQQMNLTVSALSRRIQTLEQDLGIALFERQQRTFSLRPVGQRLLEDIGPALEALSLTTEHFRRTGAASTLRIGVMQAFATTWLMPRLRNFTEAFPDIVLEYDTQPLAMARVGTDLDAAIVLLKDRPADLFCDRLMQNYIIPVCAPDLAKAFTQAHQSTTQWLQDQTILLHQDLTTVLPLWLAKMGYAGLKPKRIETFDSGAVLLEAAINGLGIAFMLDITVETALAQSRLAEPFASRLKSPLSFCLVAPEQSIRDRSLARFHGWLLKQSNANWE